MYYENVLSDYGYTPKYKCYVCDSIGLVFKQGEAGKDIPVNVCHNCGYFCRGERDYADEKIWRDAWKENGSIKLFDLPLQERCQLYQRIRDSVNQKKFFCLTDAQIQNREIDKRVFTQHGFKRKVRRKRIIIDCLGGKKDSYKYETNKLIYIAGFNGYISIVEGHKEVLLLASDYLSVYGEGVSCPVRHYFGGLMPYLFAGAYSLDKTCVLQDKEGKRYAISIK